MRLTIAAVGVLRGGPIAALVDDYAERVRRQGRAVGLSAFDLREVEAPKGLAGEARRAKENALLLDVAEGARVRVALDEGGRSVSSAAFARKLADWRDGGEKDLACLIGGADGLTAETKTAADFALAFGEMTWPHMLVRAMLCEQIYRAVTILAGHPYHRS